MPQDQEAGMKGQTHCKPGTFTLSIWIALSCQTLVLLLLGQMVYRNTVAAVESVKGAISAQATTDFIVHNLADARQFKGRMEHLEFALSQVDPKLAKEGLFGEFGVAEGLSINFLADHLPAGAKIHGFDSFEGNPEAWNGFPQGYFRTDPLPVVRPNVVLHKGWFDRSVPAFVKDHSQPIAFMHMDADLYSSTKTVLDILGERIVPGTIIAFDEFMGYAGFENDGECRAFRELVHRRRLTFKFIGYRTEQVSVRILPPGPPIAAVAETR